MNAPGESLLLKPIRSKVCKYSACRQRFIPSKPMQVVCNWRCGLKWIEEKREKEIRKQYRERKEKLKTRRDYINEAQIAFNAYIRFRDRNLPCVCCGGSLGNTGISGGGFDCGHYRSVGSAPHLRFNEHNAHGQRKQCNRWGAGRAVDYRIGLVARIGLEAVEALEADQTPAKWTIEDLKAIKSMYKAKLKALRKDRE